MAQNVAQLHDLSSKDAKMALLWQRKIEYEADKEGLLCRIEEIDYKIKEVQAEYNAMHNSLTPVMSLPMEVTCMIFQFAHEYTKQRHSTEAKLPRVEIVVSHVCSQWRSISLSCPHIWSNFCYDAHETSCNHLNRLNAYLGRSATVALDLWFDFGAVFVDHHLALLQQTLPHVERWKRITIILGWKDEFLPFLSSIRDVAAPNLEHFTFCAGRRMLRWDSPITSLQPTIFTPGAPKLRFFMMDCSVVACLPPLSNITTLRLETLDGLRPRFFSAAAFLNILTLPSLVNLSLVGNTFDLIGTGSCIAMHNLRHLRSSEHALMSLLPSIRAPQLETLIMHNNLFRREVEEPYAFPSLQKVSLLNCSVASHQAAICFARITENATDIIISQTDLTGNSFFYALQAADVASSQTLWSKVDSLACNFRLVVQSDVGLFLDFATARRENDLTLRIFDNLHAFWKEGNRSEYRALLRACTIETMDSADNPLVQPWPPGEDNTDHLHGYNEDPFTFHPY
ncbi:hypothetical protein GALMADRAFT_264330 [Galerina marginata CBS 339.88]|uniref:Uncharacterized protein n=1 Tax=Galerina marginata (strain CBS 339.88) TaxID=685588 RepID=A0A067TFS3_GALM3|nr:hypothetical protein GALMADRAFT_264330 [Galerina marginata CBS 339.88]